MKNIGNIHFMCEMNICPEKNIYDVFFLALTSFCCDISRYFKSIIIILLGYITYFCYDELST